MREVSISVCRSQRLSKELGTILILNLAGDTAQCISRDSTFRFAEIKELFHRRYISLSRATKQKGLAKPQVFSLTKNYRSHQGILKLASFVMNLLWTGKYVYLWIELIKARTNYRIPECSR